MVTIYRYKLFDQRDGDWVVQISKATKVCIEALGGRIIEGTAEQVDDTQVDAEGRHIPKSQGGGELSKW